MTALLEENPGKHNAGELITAAMILRQQIVDTDTAATGAGSVAGQIPGAWQGTDASACTALLNGIQQHLKRVSENLLGQLAGVDRYRQDLEGISRSFGPIRARIELAREWLRLHPDPASSGMMYPRGMSADAEVAYARLLAERQVRTEEIASCQRDIESLWEQRRDADRAAVAAVATHRVSDWKSARRQLVEFGIADPRRASPAQVAEVMAAKSRDILRRHPPTAESYAQLKDLLDAYGYSAEHMDAFFTALGGTEAARLVGSFPASREGRPGSESSSFPQAMRSAFVLASQRWNDSEAAAMASGLLPDVGLETLNRPDFDAGMVQDLRTGNTGLAYLLSGAAIGAPLALALARRVDQRERIQDSPVQTGTSTPLPAIIQAETAQPGAADRAAERLRDPAGLVFSQLAHSPEASHAFLTEADGADRIRHWYGRDWQAANGNDADRFEGALAVWASASIHPAGLDSAEWDQLAAGSGLIITTLAHNPHFQKDGLSPAAVESLTFAAAIQLPGLLESSFLEDAGVNPGDAITTDIRMPDGSSRRAAVLDEEVVSGVIGRIYGSGGGGAMDAFAADYSAALARHAQGTDNPIDVLGVGKRLVHLHALLDAASDGAGIVAGADQDEAAKAVIKPVESVVGLVPVKKFIPKFGDLPKPVQDGLLGLVDKGVSEGSTLAETLWAGNERHAIAAADGSEELRTLQLKAAVMATLAGALDVPVEGPVPPVSGQDADDYRTWIAQLEPVLDQEIEGRYNLLADRAGVSRSQYPESTASIMATYDDSYAHLRNAVVR